MTWTTLELSFYTFVSLLFLDCTFREGERTGGGWDFSRAVGLVLCLVWPLTLAATILIAMRESRMRAR